MTGLRQWLADLVYRPRDLAAAGPGCRVLPPHRLRGRPFIRFGQRVRVDSHAWIEAITAYGAQVFTPRVEIGDDVTIGRHATITAIGSVRIGRGCLFSEGVYISDHSHAVEGRGPRPLVERPLNPARPVDIGAFCFIGFRACVMPGVVLGEGCIVGAHTVVTRSFPAGSVIVGSPGRLLRTVQDYQ